MSTSSTKTMLAAYIEQLATPPRFFAGKFASPPRNFHTSEKVEIDISRGNEDVSIAITNVGLGYRLNVADIYTNKEMAPPVHKEAVPLNSETLLRRMAGDTPFDSLDFRAAVIERAMQGAAKVEAKIRRSQELQASQVIQTGAATLIDEDGDEVFTISYSPKATHFPTAGTAWASASGTQKLDDIDGLARVNRADGLVRQDELIFGVDAFRNFTEDSDIRALFDTRRIDQGSIVPMRPSDDGAEYRGTMEIGNYRYDVWTYDGHYTHPQTGVSTPFMDPGKVVVRGSMGRMDATFGAIPNIGRELGVTGANLIPEMPGRLRNIEGGMDLFTNVWLSPDGEQLFVGVGSRPLMIPTAIDTFGCLTTGL